MKFHLEIHILVAARVSRAVEGGVPPHSSLPDNKAIVRFLLQGRNTAGQDAPLNGRPEAWPEARRYNSAASASHVSR